VQRLYNADPRAWAQLLQFGISYTGWGYWRERFLFIIDLLTWIRSLPERVVSPYARDVEARELLTRHSVALLQGRVIDSIEFSGAELDAVYLETATRKLLSWMDNHG
jgi:hypothetical protein